MPMWWSIFTIKIKVVIYTDCWICNLNLRCRTPTPSFSNEYPAINRDRDPALPRKSLQQPLPLPLHQSLASHPALRLRRGEEHPADHHQRGASHQGTTLPTQAIEETRLAKVVNRREVHLIAYPTVKFPYNNQALLKEIETVLNQLQVPTP